MLKKFIKKTFRFLGFDLIRLSKEGDRLFSTDLYHRLNQRRLEHLASLQLDIAQSTVLEVGAGIGEHTSFFLDRDCTVTTSDAREETVKKLRSRYPNIRVLKIDLDNPPETFNELFDIIYCYGLLYHLRNPSMAIKFMARCCGKMILLETRISHGDDVSLNPCTEKKSDPRHGVSGIGCRPTRRWVLNELKKYFAFVYLPITQPYHNNFPIDWSSPPAQKGSDRAIFIASRQKIINKYLTEEIPLKQTRY